MLRASIESEAGANAGKKVGTADLAGLTEGKLAAESGITGAAALVAFVEATLAVVQSKDTPEAHDAAASLTLSRARDRVREELGSASLVDAAAVIGNFERMVRIADGIGISLDTPVNAATETIRAELGIDRFETAARTASVTGVQRIVARLVDPIVMWGLRMRARMRGTANRSRK